MIYPVNTALQLETYGRAIEAVVLRDGRAWLSAPLFATFYGQRLGIPAEVSSIMEAECLAASAALGIQALQAV